MTEQGRLLAVPLSLYYLQAAVAAAEQVFPDPPYNHNNADAPRRLFPASLHPSDHDYRGLLEQLKIDDLRYWINVHDERVVAFTGLYRYTGSEDDGEIWLGWFGVVPGMRNLSIGSDLLRWTIQRARYQNAKVLKLYTSDVENEKAVQVLYDKFGFKTYKTEPVVNTKDPSQNYTLIYKQLEL